MLPLCLEEIHRCRPYFIGLLGERYGSLPREIPPDLVERQPWLEQHREKSITELEIIHGVLPEETKDSWLILEGAALDLDGMTRSVTNELTARQARAETCLDSLRMSPI